MLTLEKAQVGSLEFKPQNSVLRLLHELGHPLEYLQDDITIAASIYLLRKNRELHPEGRSKSGNKWYPSDTEHCACCDSIRAPSCAYPWSLNRHCRSSQHVAARYGIPEKELKKRANEIEKAFIPKDGDICFKIVKIVNGKYQSFHDDTIYEIGVTMQQEAKPEHGGGYYCFLTEKAAIRHYDSFASNEKALLRCRVGGRAVRYGGTVGSKLAVSELTPIEELGREFKSA